MPTFNDTLDSLCVESRQLVSLASVGDDTCASLAWHAKVCLHRAMDSRTMYGAKLAFDIMDTEGQHMQDDLATARDCYVALSKREGWHVARGMAEAISALGQRFLAWEG